MRSRTNITKIKYILLFIILLLSGRLIVEAFRSRENSFDTPNALLCTSDDFNFKSGQVSFYNQDTLLLPQTPVPGYIQDVAIVDITRQEKQCSSKKGGTKAGKICQIDSTTYFLKHLGMSRPSSSLEEFNRRLLGNLNVTVPKTQFFLDNGVYYIGSKAIAGFKPACDMNSYIQRERFPVTLLGIYKKIGPMGIAKLGVAKTIFSDINEANWGYNDDGLAIVDLDTAPSGTNCSEALKNYLNALHTFAFDRHAGFGFILLGIQLSLNNLVNMLSIYKKMLLMPLPKYHDLNAMTYDVYHFVLNTFIDIWNETINSIKSSMPNVLANPDEPFNDMIGPVMSDHIRAHTNRTCP